MPGMAALTWWARSIVFGAAGGLVGIVIAGVVTAYLDGRARKGVVREHRRGSRRNRDSGSGASTRGLAWVTAPGCTGKSCPGCPICAGPRVTSFAQAAAAASAAMRSLIGALGASPGGMPYGPPRPVAEPVIAWKHAYIEVDDSGVYFRGIGVSARYGVESVAECALNGHLEAAEMGMEHGPAPSRYCRCGFYAVKNNLDPFDPVNEGRYIPVGQVLLQVELYGRIIVHTQGYRAEKQRVLAVYSPRGHALGRCRAEKSRMDPMWNHTGYPSGQCDGPAVCWADDKPMCADHAMAHELRRCAGIGPISLQLATDVIPDLIPAPWHWIPDRCEMCGSGDPADRRIVLAGVMRDGAGNTAMERKVACINDDYHGSPE